MVSLLSDTGYKVFGCIQLRLRLGMGCPPPLTSVTPGAQVSVVQRQCQSQTVSQINTSSDQSAQSVHCM